MKSVAVIGKNFGDEGKGLVTAALCRAAKRPLIVKHNGGAQAGHTVEDEATGRRFIHHQIGSGAEYGAPTLLAASFHPDLYQLGKELDTFRGLFGFYPAIFAQPEAAITILDDVLLNMAVESKRADARHGSCGMGIHASCERTQAGFAVTVGDAANGTQPLLARLRAIRAQYSLPQAEALGIASDDPYFSMLRDETVLENYVDEVCRSSRFVSLTDADGAWLEQFDTILFETGQGLLLDMDHTVFAPHLTHSHTGTAEALRFLKKRDLALDEAVYVTRPYVTRHGAGPLPCACEKDALPGVRNDRTNTDNPWQGTIRYARHESVQAFLQPVLDDAQSAGILPSLAITHLDETNGMLYFQDGNLSAAQLLGQIGPACLRCYGSEDHQHIRILYDRTQPLQNRS